MNQSRLVIATRSHSKLLLTLVNNTGTFEMAISRKYYSDLRTGVLAATALGPVGAFVGPADAAAIFSVWTTMFVSMVRKSGHEMDDKFVIKFISIVGTGVVGYYAGCKSATWLFHAIPGAGTLTAMGLSSAMNALFTYKFGTGVATLIERGELDLQDVAATATCLLALVCTMPTPSDIKGMLDLHSA